MPSPTEIAAQLALAATTAVSKDDDAVIDYLAGETEVADIAAVKAGKTSRVFTQERMGMVHRPTDWIVERALIESVFPPDEGHFFRETKGSKVALYRVCRLPDEDGCWRDHIGTGGSYVRIHSELYEES